MQSNKVARHNDNTTQRKYRCWGLNFCWNEKRTVSYHHRIKSNENANTFYVLSQWISTPNKNLSARCSFRIRTFFILFLSFPYFVVLATFWPNSIFPWLHMPFSTIARHYFMTDRFKQIITTLSWNFLHFSVSFFRSHETTGLFLHWKRTVIKTSIESTVR